MPGWAAGNLFIGLTLGWGMKKALRNKVSFSQYIFILLWILVITAIGILGIKSLVEKLLYAQPMAVRIAKNSYAFVADVIVMWIGLPVYQVLKGRIFTKTE